MSHKEIIQSAEQSVVYIVIRDAVGESTASGTGFVIDDKGHIATNFHVISDAVTATAQTRDGDKINITGVVAYDADNDLAILETGDHEATLSPVNLEKSRIEQGDTVIAIGHPAGFRFTATNGIVSAVRKTSELPTGFKESVGADDNTVWIQTSAAISGGNSGGPLMDEYGTVVGINTWIAEGENLGFAIHAKHLDDLIENISEPQPFPIPGMGIITDPTIANLRTEFLMEVSVLREALSAATTEREYRQIQKEQTPFSDYGKKFLEIADKQEGRVKLEALTQAFSTLRRSRSEADYTLFENNVERLYEFMESPDLADGAMSLTNAYHPKAVEVLKRIINESNDDSARGAACIALSGCLNSINETETYGMIADAGDTRPEYVALLKRATNEFGNGRYRGQKIETLYQAYIDEAMVDSGMPAPEIEGTDLHGETHRLSDHRGKVVILDFWVDWCPYCRNMYPHNKKLVEKYADEPFVLLGVNCDDGDRGVHAAKLNGLDYVSWKDGSTGPINETWQISGFPTLVVLDRNGVIRKRLSTTDFETLDKIVEDLLKEDQELWPANLITFGSEWNYWDASEAPAADWTQRVNSSWSSNNAPFGFAANDATQLEHGVIGTPQTISYLFQKEFSVADTAQIKDLVASFYVDDGIVIHLNGKEVYRSNLDVDAEHGAAATRAQKGNGRVVDHAYLNPKFLKNGTNVLSIAVHQASEWSADLRFDLALATNVVQQCDSIISDEEADESKRIAALKAIECLGRPGIPVVPSVKKLLESKEENVRIAAYRALVSMAGKKAGRLTPPAPSAFKDIASRKTLAHSLNNRSWDIAMSTNQSREDYRRALIDIMVGNGLSKSGGALNTQALAFARFGEPKLALRTLSEARKEHGNQTHDYAVAAIAYKQLGQNEKAAAMAEKTRDLAKKRKEEISEDLRKLLTEVE